MRREAIEREVDIPLDAATHRGDLGLPPGAEGLVIFAHGSGSSRRSSRNRFVAEALRRAGLGTLLFDLLTEIEDRDYERRFDIDLLTHRLLLATQWAGQQAATRGLALDDLARVQAPTLLIVGGDDAVVIELNRTAYRELCGEKELKIIPGATHLFEEPGTLEQVATAAAHWFARHLTGK